MSSMAAVMAVLLLAVPAGCGGDDDDNGNDNSNDGERQAAPVAGTFVGKLSGSEQFVAVVAAPPPKGRDRREVAAFVCDGDQFCSWFSAATSGNDVVAKSQDGETETEVELSRKGATGTVELPDGETGRYNAREATATSGLYDLTVTRRGKVTGASAAGVGLTGSVTLPPPGTGRLKLADGTRIRFDVVENSAGEGAGLQAGQLRLIVLPDGQLRGAGMARGGDSEAAFLVRSSSK
jgi:hypothetical protein